ncbi:MAG: ZIP family metal transporter [Pseudomonadales bacterium]
MNLVLFSILVFLLVFAFGYLPFIRKIASGPHVLGRMTALAGGFLIGAALLIALPEGFEVYLHATEGGELSGRSGWMQPAFIAGLAVLGGFLMMLILEGFGFGHDVHEEHHDHSHEHGHQHVNHPEGSAKMLVVGLSMHALMDGFAIGAAYALGELALSLQLALVILMHKFPAAFSLSAYSLHERHDKKRSMTDLLLFAAATPLAILLSATMFAAVDQSYIGLMLLFSAGTFIYVATVDVLPNIHIQEKSRETLWLVLGGITAMVVLSALIGMLVPEGHIH